MSVKESVEELEGLKLPEKKIKYMQHGEEVEQIIGSEGLEWWNKFAEIWNHTEIIEVIDIKYTKEQTNRLEEVKDLDASAEVLVAYAIDGTVGEGLEHLNEAKEKGNLTNLVADLVVENKKKDIMIAQLTNTVADLTLEIKGGK